MDGGYDGAKIRKARTQAGVSVKEISDLLISKGLKATPNTIYSWENGNSQPTPDALLYMCSRYGVNDPLSFFGYTAPAPAELEQREYDNDLLKQVIGSFNQLNVEGQERLAETADDMVQSGKYIKSGQDEVAQKA